MAINKFIRYRLLLLPVVIGLVILAGPLSCSAPAEEPLPSDITKIPLERVLGKGQPVLAEFGWRTCIPCKAMKPLLEELAVEYKGRVNVLIVEVYEQEALSRKYAIRGIPTQIFFDNNGKQYYRHEGYLSKENILKVFSDMGVE